MKKAVLVLLSIFIVMILAGCGAVGEPENQQKTKKVVKEESLTSKALSGITEESGISMDIEMTVDGEPLRMLIQSKGDVFYAEGTVEGVKMLLFANSEGFYQLVPSLGQGYRYDKSEGEEILLGMKGFALIGTFSGIAEYEKETRTIGGKNYKAEVFDEGGQQTVFAFDKKDKLTYIISQEDGKPMTTRVYSIRNKVDESLLVLPKGYEIIDQ